MPSLASADAPSTTRLVPTAACSRPLPGLPPDKRPLFGKIIQPLRTPPAVAAPVPWRNRPYAVAKMPRRQEEGGE